MFHDGDNDDGGTKIQSSQIRVYKYNDTTCLTLGRDLYGDNYGYKLQKVSLSASGDRLSMFTGNQPGYTRVYDLVDGDWQQVVGRLSGCSYDRKFGANEEIYAGGGGVDCWWPEPQQGYLIRGAYSIISAHYLYNQISIYVVLHRRRKHQDAALAHHTPEGNK